MIGLDLFEGLSAIETKGCSICNRDLPVTAFAKEGSKGYLRYECRECASKHSKIVNRIKKYAPKASIDHRCPICLRQAHELSTYGKNKKSVWVADHDHKTEQFRGWLCHKCNMGLGNLGDDSERCRRAMDYLNNS
jgi:hypothetical protein